MKLATPKYDLNEFPDVYDPSEDTFLLLDALEQEIDFIQSLQPKIVAEIGSGSGIVISALSSLSQGSCVHFATDINPEACAATKKTAFLNDVDINILNMNLLDCFKGNLFDMIIFNPPYVVTDEEELVGNSISRAWAGGHEGRVIIDKLLFSLNNLLTKNGVCYMVLLKCNNIRNIKEVVNKLKLTVEVVLERRIPGEHLYVVKFTRQNSI